MKTFHPKLPLDEGDRIVRIVNHDAATSTDEPRTLHDLRIWREQLRAITELGAYRTMQRNLITDAGTQPMQVAEISASAFPLTRVPPRLGRPLTEADEEPGAADVVVIGYDVWQSRFAGASDVIGRTVQLGRVTATVVGVMPDGFGFPVNHELWVPLRMQDVPPRSGPEVEVFGRLADGASEETAQAELTAIGQRIAATNPATHAQLRPRVEPYVARSVAGMVLVNIAALLVLGLASANVAALMFARTAMRESEIVVRNALGASRLRVMGQLVVESLVLTLVAAAVGLSGAMLVMGYVHRQIAARQFRLPFWYDMTLEPLTVFYTAGLAVVGAVFVGLLPALKATGPRVQAGLTKMSSGGTSMQFGGVWSLIIVGQIAITVLCLPIGIAAAADIVQKQRMRSAFPSAGYVTFRPELDRETALSAAAEPTDAEVRAQLAVVYEELARRLRSEPGVTDVTFARALPGMSYPLRRVEVQRDAEPPTIVNANTEGSRVRYGEVDIGFFDAFRLPVMAGRGFRQGDVGTASPVVVINESLARNIGGNAIGVRLRFNAPGEETEPGEWHEVVGVVRNAGMDPTRRGDADFMYMPAAPADVAPMTVAVRVADDAAAFTPRVAAIATQLDPGLRLYDLVTLEEVIRRIDLPEVQLTFAGIGVVLLAIGLSAASLYALMSVAVARRRREIGIRLAIGASPRAVLVAIFERGAKQIGLGLLIGNVIFAVIVTFVHVKGAFGITPGYIQPTAMVLPMLIVSGVMALVGFLACLVPARRALRVQPTEALKGA